MPVKLNGSTSGSVTVQAPAVAGTNTLTLPAATGNLLSDQSIVPGSSSVPTNGMYLPAANALGFATNSTNAMYINSSQNVGIGTTSPGALLHVGTITAKIRIGATAGSEYLDISRDSATGNIIYNAAQTSYGTHNFQIAGTEAMRIDTNGNLLVGTTTLTSGRINTASANGLYGLVIKDVQVNGAMILFQNSSGTTVGQITSNATNTAYNTSSDYRLKENVAPIITGLATVSALKPVTYDWKFDGSQGEGFIAHELAEIVPYAVVGEKDAVNEDGSIKPQGVDYSKIVVHLVAAIQELSAKNDALEARLVALEAK